MTLIQDDYENQKAMSLAKQVDPLGQRTIGTLVTCMRTYTEEQALLHVLAGVLTKPDRLPNGAKKEKDQWLEVIEGRRFPLRHGYFCTRQPDDAERSNGITSEEARTAEKNFFSGTSPWSQSPYGSRFGTPSLVNNISSHLIQLIEKTWVAPPSSFVSKRY